MRRFIDIIFPLCLLCCSCGHRGGNSVPAPVSAEPDAEQKEQQVVDFLSGLSQMPLFEAQGRMETYFRKNCTDTLVVRLVRKYLYDPNSPMRNEDLYLPFVKGLAQAESTPDSLRNFYRREALMCSKNQIGQKVPDFVFRTLKGKNIRLYDVPGEYVMLFFSNPGCQACKGIIEQVEYLQPVALAIEAGRLSVVNVYIDEDLKAWKEYAVNYPDNWYSGYDPKYILRSDELFNIRAIPSLYLLDADKKVIMKDAPTERVLMYLMNVLQ